MSSSMTTAVSMPLVTIAFASSLVGFDSRASLENTISLNFYTGDNVDFPALRLWSTLAEVVDNLNIDGELSL